MLLNLQTEPRTITMINLPHLQCHRLRIDISLIDVLLFLLKITYFMENQVSFGLVFDFSNSWIHSGCDVMVNAETLH